MNPPAALSSAMSRDRKPFTYTPGGLDLSQIKSQRMAERLMRNAMNPGVSEVPSHPVTPPVTPTVPIPLPNYNCLPVQVFPAMPPNPKTLLKTRSNPDARVKPPVFVNNKKFENSDTLYKNTPTYSQQINNNRPVSMHGCSAVPPVNTYNTPRLNYGSDGYTPSTNESWPTSSPFAYAPVIAPVTSPVIPPVASLVAPPVTSSVAPPVIKSVIPPFTAPVSTPAYAPFEAPAVDFNTSKVYSESINQKCDDEDIVPINESVKASIDFSIKPIKDYTDNTLQDVLVNPIQEIKYHSNDIAVSATKEETTVTPLVTKLTEEIADIDKEQREVKVVKKQVTKENKVEQNGDQNGDANGVAETTVKIPIKKSGAKTETKVEIETRTLPDGSTEEVKTTTTKTTIDGRTEIKTRTETTIIPKEEESEEEVVEEEEEERESAVQEAEEQQNENVEEPETVTVTQTISAPNENGNVITKEERSEVTIAKKVVVVQESKPEQSEVEESEEVDEELVEEVEAEPVTIVLKKQPTPEPVAETKPIEEEEKEVEQEEIVEDLVQEEIEQEEVEQKQVIEESVLVQKEVAEEEEVEVQKEDEEEKEIEEEQVEEQDDIKPEVPEKDDEEEQEEEEEYEEAEEENIENVVKEEENTVKEVEVTDKQENELKDELPKEETKLENAEEQPTEQTKSQKEDEHIIPIQVKQSEESKPEMKEEEPKEKPVEFTIPLREPSVPLDKVEEVEIKPIGMTPIITKTHTENTEIITSTIDPTGGLSKQTEYNKIENIVTVNRTTKILDHNYENLTQQGIPTVRTYFPPPGVERISASPMLSSPYQPVYPPQPQTQPSTERRHSLLLERLSMERQMPSDLHQFNSQSYEQTQYQEPQSEVLTVSNVKPSTITNSQWYQQTKQTQNTIYNNVSSTPTPVGAPWAQPKSPQPQQQYQPQQPQPQYQSPQPQYQSPQPQYQPPPTQPQYQPPPIQPQFQPSYQSPAPTQFQRGTTPIPQLQRGTTPQPQFQKVTTPQPQYQAPYSEPPRDRTPTSYSPYSTTPARPTSTIEQPSAPLAYSYLNKDTSQSYQTNTISCTTRQLSSGYVPPPWEQDSSYTSVNNTSEKYYQEVPPTNTYTPGPTQGWIPPKPTKAPIAYIPPAPNQSFVKPVSKIEPPRLPGRKTYYSEYERRYITVPESTYIPSETKHQPQPDPSPQYYYDNNEPSEPVEPQWRKELREFTEKTSQTQTTEMTSSVQPPWEVDPKYGKTAAAPYTPTPTWSQTLRPQSSYERSFESEFVSKEWPKTNTLGRGRVLSSSGKMNSPIPDRVRGVSVDRYNPNNYQPPAEHPPVQSHTLTTPVNHAHNPNVPGYHARASAEPREFPTNYQQRVYRETRENPLQSRSFKYLQWITGTED